MRSTRLYLTFLLCLSFISSCATGPTAISQRGIGGFDKPGKLIGKTNSPVKTEKKPELYVRQRTQDIKPESDQNETGSLFRVDDERNYYFMTKAPVHLGQFLDVKVVPQRSDLSATTAIAAAAPTPPPPPQPGAIAQPGSPTNPVNPTNDPVVDEMLKALPQLAPAGESPPLLKTMRVKVVQLFDNGDVMALFKRSSKNENEASDISVTARIPYRALVAEGGISTLDLGEVHWTEVNRDKLSERHSVGWEDEYSLRVSGFTEARSVYAKQLDEKKLQLENVRTKLQQNLSTFSRERTQVADERERLRQERAKIEEEKAKQESRIKELEGQVTSQKEEIDGMKLAQEQAAAEAEAKAAEEEGKAKAAEDKKSGAAKAAPKK